MNAFAGLILLTGVMVTNSVLAETVRLNIQSSVPTSLEQLGTGGVRLVETVNLISADEVQARFFEPNALVAPGKFSTRYQPVPSMRDGPRPYIGRPELGIEHLWGSSIWADRR